MKYRGLTLDTFQHHAISALEEGHSALVSAPTGTGKTLIADWIIEACLRAGEDVVYTAPVKALSNQKFRDYCKLHGEKNVGLVTGDLVIRHDAPCRVMTTEILRNMLLSGDGVPDLRAVVLDELHFLDDRERGTVWEEVLIYLPQRVQVLGLSATLPNLDDLAAWMQTVRGRHVEVVTEDERAVPLQFHLASKHTGVISADRLAKGRSSKRGRGTRQGRGRRRGRGKRGQMTRHTDIFRMLVDEDLLPYLYFTFSRKNTESFARTLARRVRPGDLLSREDLRRMDAHLDASESDLGGALTPGLRQLYRTGVAFHHAGLHVQLKVLVEELYEMNLIKVLYCTSTFALGINMPARSAVFDGLEKYDGTEVRPLTVRQFMQKAGRAGRRGLDEVGHVVVRLDPDDYDEARPSIRRYLKGSYEPVRSSFNLSFNSVVNLLDRHDEATCRELVARSFLAWHLDRVAEASREKVARLESAGVGGKRLRRARRHARRTSDRCWAEFDEKVQLLHMLGYISEEGEFQAGARLIQHIQISEILVAELVLAGIFEDVDAGTLYGVLCALTLNLPRSVRRNYGVNKQDRLLARDIQRILGSDAVVQSDKLAGTQVSFEREMIPLGRWWHDGESLDTLLERLTSSTDYSGSLISAFRRAKDLASQLRAAYRAAGMEEHAQQLSGILRTVSRDEVEVVA